MSTGNHRFTVDEFRQFQTLEGNEDRRFELINGVIIEKDIITHEQAAIVGSMVYFLSKHLEAHGGGQVYVKSDFVPPPRIHHITTPLIPDVGMMINRGKAMITADTPPSLPTIAIEVKARANMIIHMRRKAEFYINNGTRLVWLIIPEYPLVEVYRPGEDVILLKKDDSLTGYDVLPGFTLPIKELLEDE